MWKMDFLFVFVYGPHLMILRTYSQVCIQGSLLEVGGGPYEMVEIKLWLVSCKAMPAPLYNHSGLSSVFGFDFLSVNILFQWRIQAQWVPLFAST